MSPDDPDNNDIDIGLQLPSNDSPSSSYEPSIDQIVNDFDDEETMEEEEALAECQDANDEIERLREESEIPLEELLAKYKQLVEDSKSNECNQNLNSKKKSKKFNKLEKRKKFAKLSDSSQVKNNESGEEDDGNKESQSTINDDDEDESSLPETEENNDKQSHHLRRTHLMELYPENFLKMIDKKVTDNEEAGEYDSGSDFGDYFRSFDVRKTASYEEDDFEDDEDDLDYAKKTIMVGAAYQAVIPVGLSKYGDVRFLPYENEDKLIWEPSQVSEKQVEDYLIKAKEIRLISEEEKADDRDKLDSQLEVNIAESDLITKPDTLCSNLSSSSSPSVFTATATLNLNNIKGENTETTENVISVKDNEQALHLLVQCGYDFKEALRRKRLNAVPLTGSMSLWSEEECKKFEEGIQKYGKDFLKIRQHQVRTRSMRELVQFYYLWKKSERRDQDFADSDTVDHMEMYLNEGDYNCATTAPSSNSGTNSYGNTKVQSNSITMLTVNNSNNKLQSSESSSTSFQNKKLLVATQKNFSIMNETKQRASEAANSINKSTSLRKVSRRRGGSNIETLKILSSQNDLQSASGVNLRTSTTLNSK